MKPLATTSKSGSTNWCTECFGAAMSVTFTAAFRGLAPPLIQCELRMMAATERPPLATGVICWARPAGRRVSRRGCCAPPISVRWFVSAGPKSRHAPPPGFMTTICPLGGKRSTSFPWYTHMRKWWVVNDNSSPPRLTITEPPRSKGLLIGTGTKVQTSRLLFGGTTKRGTRSLMGRRADQDARPHEVGHGAEHQAQALLLPADLGIVPADGQTQVHGARDGARVAALALAPTVERGVALREDLRGEEGYVPAVSVARHQPEETLLPLPADPQAEPLLHRPRLAERALEAELPALERDALAVEERAQGLRRLLQEVEPLLDRRERDAEGARLDLVPSRPDAELAAPAAQVIDGDRGLREQTDGPVAHAEDQAADPYPLRLRSERGHGRHALEGRLRRVGEVRHRVEVVPDRAPVKAALVGDPPEAAEVGHRAVLRAGVDAEAHRSSLPGTRAVAREPELVGERLEPFLGRAEAQLGLLGARRVAVQLVLDHVARAAVELVGGERRLAVGAARPRLRDRDLACRRQALRQPPERLASHVPRALELDRHHRDHLLHGLEGAELHAELLALADVAGRHLEDRVGAADHVGAEERSEPRAQRGEARPGPPGAARERAPRQPHVFQAHGALPVLAEGLLRPDAHAGRAGRDEPGRHALSVARRDQEGVRDDALEDVALLTLEAEGLAAPAHPGREGGRVGARALLRDRERHPRLAARDGRQPRALLRRRAERRETEPARDLHEDAEGRGGAAELLDEQPQVEQRRALPPVGRGQPVAEPAEARDRLPEGRVVPLLRAVPREAPLARDLGGEEAARRLPDRLLLLRRRELHGLLPRQAEPALRDDGALDLVGAAPEALHRRGGVEPLAAAGERRRRLVGRELAGQPEHLHADRGEMRVQLAHVHLRDRALLGRHLALVDEPGVQEPDLPAHLDAHLEVGQRAPHPRDGAEGPPVPPRAPREGDQLVQQAADHPHRADHDALEIERHHGVVEAHAALAHQVVARHAHVFEEDRVGADARPGPERLHGDARAVHGHDQHRDALVLGRLGLGAHRNPVVARGVRAGVPDLLPVDDP